MKPGFKTASGNFTNFALIKLSDKQTILLLFVHDKSEMMGEMTGDTIDR